MDQLFAYFIGGPWDLTKQVIKHVMPEIRMARPAPMMGLMSSHEDPMEEMTIRTSSYRPAYEGPMTGGHRCIIYQYEGEVR